MHGVFRSVFHARAQTESTEHRARGRGREAGDHDSVFSSLLLFPTRPFILSPQPPTQDSYPEFESEAKTTPTSHYPPFLPFPPLKNKTPSDNTHTPKRHLTYTSKSLYTTRRALCAHTSTTPLPCIHRIWIDDARCDAMLRCGCVGINGRVGMHATRLEGGLLVRVGRREHAGKTLRDGREGKRGERVWRGMLVGVLFFFFVCDGWEGRLRERACALFVFCANASSTLLLHIYDVVVSQ